MGLVVRVKDIKLICSVVCSVNEIWAVVILEPLYPFIRIAFNGK